MVKGAVPWPVESDERSGGKCAAQVGTEKHLGRHTSQSPLEHVGDNVRLPVEEEVERTA